MDMESPIPETYFHLSDKADWRSIVASTNPQCGANGCFGPRIPKRSYQERRRNRVCIAPRIWQCVYGIPIDSADRVLLNIYRLEVAAAERCTFESHQIADVTTTHEHWITNAIVKQNGGTIPLQLVGWLLVTSELTLAIKIWAKKQTMAGVDPHAVDESQIWEIDGDRFSWPRVGTIK